MGKRSPRSPTVRPYDMSEAHRTSRQSSSGVLRSENSAAMGFQLRFSWGWQEQVYKRGLEIVSLPKPVSLRPTSKQAFLASMSFARSKPSLRCAEEWSLDRQGKSAD